MSQYVIEREDGKTIRYGFDHVLGYFLNVEKGEDLLKEYQSYGLTKPMSRGEIYIAFKKYGVPEKHLKKVLMDLPI